MKIKKIIFLLLALFCCKATEAQLRSQVEGPQQLTRILFLFDASQSMYGKWQSASKMDVAKKLLNQLLDSLRYTPNIEIALRVYGHQKRFPPQDCDDTKLEVGFNKGNVPQIKSVIQNLKPSGTTPIARSLQACADDFPNNFARNIIILITDGVEECNGDPCAISLALQKKGVFLKPFVIGMGLDESFKKTFECVGNYFDAYDETQFSLALNVVISQALNQTTMQVNLLDLQHEPTETNVNMTFTDHQSGVIKYNYIHTLNGKGNPDTLTIDPLGTYDLIVHTIPQVRMDSITLTPGKHTIIGLDAPQGYLNLKFAGMGDYKKLPAIIRKHEENQTLHVQSFNTTEKYLVGKYDLEILTLPRIYHQKVDISQSKTTTLQIPQPGLVTFIKTNMGYGSLYVEDAKGLTWIYNLDNEQFKENIVMQPGTYAIVFRPKNSRESIYTVKKSFTVKQGESIVINLN